MARDLKSQCESDDKVWLCAIWPFASAFQAAKLHASVKSTPVRPLLPIEKLREEAQTSASRTSLVRLIKSVSVQIPPSNCAQHLVVGSGVNEGYVVVSLPGR